LTAQNPISIELLLNVVQEESGCAWEKHRMPVLIVEPWYDGK